jgi:DNA-directed RNA polymerase subunit beta'
MYVITNPGESNYAYRQLISAREYDQLQNSLCDETGDLTDLDITAQTGGEAIETLLKSINLEEETIFLKQALSESGSELKRKKIAKKLELIKGLLKTGTKPEWMVIRVLPILPPATRPMINIENGYGRAGTIGLNELYKSVLTRNERLRRFRSMNAPLDITRNEIRALQQAVDSVIDNGRNGSPALDSNGVEYRSIGRYWKGKDSLCRQRLLGKRVDYSGRSVIVVGPHLRLDQCALPRRMALQLYQPFVLSKLESYGFAATLKSARKMIEQEDPVVWDILQEVIRNRPVILNRQPTLHRLGMQAFNPILTHGKAIQINPLVCSAFNADFDGDQMAVHLPLSVEARLEAHTILLSTRNLLSAAHGNPVIAPSQDIVLGIYYMTHTHDKAPKIDRVYSDFYEVKAAIELNKISLQSKIRFYYNEEIVDTTPGRVLLHREMPDSMSLHEVNKTFKKSDVSQLLYSVYKNFGEKEMVILADAIKTIGFYWATHSGISVGKSDFLELKTLSAHIKNANDFVHSYQKQCHDGLITANELSSKTIDTWTECVTNISADLMKEIAEPTERGLNHLYMMLYSGARGSKTQLAQMLGARGLITKSTQNKIIETAIENNYRKGLSAHEVFISAFGTRKGTADTALKTSNAGYLTRRIVTACQSCVVTEYDCGTSEGLQVQAHIDEITNKPDITDMVFGKVLAHDIVSPTSGEVLFAKGTLLQEDECMVLRDAGVHTASVRSPIKCNSSISMCAKCYGLDLAKRKLVTLGEAVGIIAAQSIGEPGAQLTMNTFHIGGIAQHAASKSSISTIARCKVSYIGKSVINTHDETIIVARNAELIMTSETGIEISRTRLPYGAKVSISGEITEANTIVAQWDAYNNVIIADHKGKIILHDIVEGISLQKEIDELTGNTVNTITDWRYYGGKSLHPRIAIEAEDGKSYIFNLTPDTLLEVEGGQMVEVGHVLGKIPKESLVSKDITAGLPKVAELLEARNTKCASIADDDGYIEQDNSRRVSNKITLIASEGRKFEYTVPNDAIALVRDGDFVRKGDQLTSGELGPSDLLRVLGVDAVANYLIKEVQNVYQVQGAKINNKHIEVIVHQMLQKYLVIDAGDSDLGDDSYVSRVEIHRLNESLIEQGLKPIKYQAVVMGITSAAVHGSTLSSVAFQNSIKTLVRVSITAGVDTKVDSPQDCVLAAQLMKAGTGYACRAIKNNQSHAINKPSAPDQND